MCKAAQETPMTAGRVIARIEDGVGWLVFSHEARRNALTDAMALEAVEHLAALAADPDVRLCVMRGESDKAFISGADIGGLPVAGQRPIGAPAPVMQLLDALAGFEKPLLAMIRGWCLGGGLAVALKADMRLCAEDARFGIPAARLGVGYPTAGLADLLALVSPSAAKQILFVAEHLSAEHALRIGLVDEVTAAGALEARLAEIARKIGENAPLSLRAAKAGIDHLTRGAHTAEDIAALGARCFASADYAEGRAAFLEKRAPKFRGA
jgi:enoyl-CoA hydratase/carnithine racemase